MSNTRKVRRARKARERAEQQLNTALLKTKAMEQKLEEAIVFTQEWEYHKDFLRNMLGNNTAALPPELIEAQYRIQEITNRQIAPSLSLQDQAPRPYRASQVHELRIELEKITHHMQHKVSLYAHLLRNDRGELSYAHTEEMNHLMQSPEFSRHPIQTLLKNAEHNFPLAMTNYPRT